MRHNYQQGDTIGRYRLERLLGQGGMGSVFVARHELTERRVAVKLISGGFEQHPEAFDRFVAEARAASRLNHPNVVSVLDMGEYQGVPYLVMELLEGMELGSLLATRGRLSPRETLEYLLPIASALANAHAHGIVHRDLKPANVFISRDDTGRAVPKLLDFGIAKMRQGEHEPGSTRLTKTNQTMGTPLYMAPEQIRDAKHAGPRSDVWSFGVMLYECLTGALPFQGETFVELVLQILTGPAPSPSVASRVPDVPALLVSVVDRCMNRDPAQRYAGGDALLAALEQCVADLGLSPAAARGSTRGDDRPPQAAPEGRPAYTVGYSSPPPASARRVRDGFATMVQTVVKAAKRVRKVASERPAPPKARLTVVGTEPFSFHLPTELRPYAEPIEAFLAAAFENVRSRAGGVAELDGIRFEDADPALRYFAMFPATSLNADQMPRTLHATTIGVALEPLEARVRALPKEVKKIIITITLERPVHDDVWKLIGDYRERHNALLVPLFVEQIVDAHAEGRLVGLFRSGLTAFHDRPDPYDTPWPYVSPDQFTGVGSQVSALCKLLAARGEVIALDGLPGSGKSTLLSMATAATKALEESKNTRFYELTTVAGGDFSWTPLVQEIARCLGVGVSDETVPEDPLSGVRCLTDGAYNAVFVVDKADWLLGPLLSSRSQEVAKILAFLSSFQRFCAHAGCRLVVVSAAARVLEEPSIADCPNPMASSIKLVPVGALPAEAFKRAIELPGWAVGVRFDANALLAIQRASAGHIGVGRQLASRALKLAARNATPVLSAVRVKVNHVTQATNDLATKVDTFGRRGLGWLDPTQERVLRTVATGAATSTVQLEARFPLQERNQVHAALARLERLKLVDAEQGRFFVTIPLLQQWLLRRGEVGRERGMSPRKAVFIASAAACSLGVFTMVYAYYTTTVPNLTSEEIVLADNTLRAEYPASVLAGEVFALTVWVEPAQDILLFVRGEPGTRAFLQGVDASTPTKGRDQKDTVVADVATTIPGVPTVPPANAQDASAQRWSFSPEGMQLPLECGGGYCMGTLQVKIDAGLSEPRLGLYTSESAAKPIATVSIVFDTWREFRGKLASILAYAGGLGVILLKLVEWLPKLLALFKLVRASEDA